MLNVNVTEEPVIIEGDDAAVVLQRVSIPNHRSFGSLEVVNEEEERKRPGV